MGGLEAPLAPRRAKLTLCCDRCVQLRVCGSRHPGCSGRHVMRARPVMTLRQPTPHCTWVSPVRPLLPHMWQNKVEVSGGLQPIHRVC